MTLYKMYSEFLPQNVVGTSNLHDLYPVACSLLSVKCNEYVNQLCNHMSFFGHHVSPSCTPRSLSDCTH